MHTELNVGLKLQDVELIHLGPGVCKVSQFHAHTLVHQEQAIEIRLVDIQGPNAVLETEGLLDLGSQLCQSLWHECSEVKVHIDVAFVEMLVIGVGVVNEQCLNFKGSLALVSEGAGELLDVPLTKLLQHVLFDGWNGLLLLTHQGNTANRVSPTHLLR